MIGYCLVTYVLVCKLHNPHNPNINTSLFKCSCDIRIIQFKINFLLSLVFAVVSKATIVMVKQ